MFSLLNCFGLLLIGGFVLFLCHGDYITATYYNVIICIYFEEVLFT